LAGGAPLGNNNAVKNKPYHDALRRVLAQYELRDKEGKVVVPAGEALRAVVESQVEAAWRGDVQAQKEIADRLDGKPKQQIEASGPDGGAFVTKIVREVVPPSGHVESKP
jgi:hypothetical protein